MSCIEHGAAGVEGVFFHAAGVKHAGRHTKAGTLGLHYRSTDQMLLSAAVPLAVTTMSCTCIPLRKRLRVEVNSSSTVLDEFTHVDEVSSSVLHATS
jgi:hypothetical protein